MKAAIGILRGLLALVLCIALVINGWLLFSQLVLKENPPSVLGFSPILAADDSMAPTFSQGDLVLLDKGDAAAPGDVVAFLGEANTPIIRRIIGTTEGMYITQGDAAEQADSQLLAPGDVLGPCIAGVPGGGEILLFFSTPLGLGALLAAGVLLLLLPGLLSGVAPRGRHGGSRH